MTMGDTSGMHTNPGETSMREAARVSPASLSFPLLTAFFACAFLFSLPKYPNYLKKQSQTPLWQRQKRVHVSIHLSVIVITVLSADQMKGLTLTPWAALQDHPRC